MGEVYRAVDTTLGRDVAIKLLPPDVAVAPERVTRLRREAQLLAALNHPNIAAIYGLHEAGGNVFLVLELANGEDLAQLLRRGPLSLDMAISVGSQIAHALEEAHEKGIVHRDLKPANVLVDKSGHVRVLDFGLARRWRAAEDDQTIAGTLEYMSLDQLVGEAPRPAHDVYALGVIFYEMLTGRLPYGGHNVVALVARHLDAPPKRLLELRPNLAADLERLCLLCLERDADKRPTARALATAAEGLHRGRPLDGLLSPSSAPPHVPKALTSAPLPAALTTEATIIHAWSWTLKASARSLWPWP